MTRRATKAVMKMLKWLGIVCGVLIGLLAVAAAVLYFIGGARLATTYDVDVVDLEVASDEATIARGRHLAEAVTICTDCHGAHLEGKLLFDEPDIATLYAPNLTSGRGGRGGQYQTADLVRAIRHGVNREGRGMMVMHSDQYQHLGRDDLGALVAFVKSVPPVDNEPPPMHVTAMGRIMIALGLFDTPTMPLVPAEVIAHDAPVPDVPAPGPTAAYGGYLVSIALCPMCHGANLTGAPPIEEGAPPGPNITVFGEGGHFSEEQFRTAIRTGAAPNGRTLDARFMPWRNYRRMTDDELRAIRLYLGSLGTSR